MSIADISKYVNYSKNNVSYWLKKYNLKTVPQIFIDGNLIGGYTDLEKNIEEIVSGKTKT